MPKDDDRPKTRKLNTGKKLGTTFHRTFWLSRPQIRQLLKATTYIDSSSQISNCLTTELIRENTDLGTIQVEAMPRYARACGLLDSQLCLTNFGEAALKYDSLLENINTLWLMHYYLSVEHGYGPPFWSKLVSTRFLVGNEIDQKTVADDIRTIVTEIENRELKERDARSTANVFLSSYYKADALGGLAILEEVSKDRYRVLEPAPPSVWVFGLALLDFWETRYGFDRLTINLEDLTAPGGLADIFLIGAGRVNQYLRRLQEEGYVEVFRLAPPYQVVLRHHDPEPLLEKLYAFDNDEA